MSMGDAAFEEEINTEMMIPPMACLSCAPEYLFFVFFFFFQAEDGIRDLTVTGVQTCALPISAGTAGAAHPARAGGHDRPLEAGARRRAMILLNPGPVNVSPRVTGAVARGDLCHREPEYGDLQASIRSRLVRAFAPAGGFTAVLITGSGTAALEAAVTSVLSARGRLVVVSNGVYGERIAAMAAAARLPHTVVEGAWTEPPDLAALERALGAPDVEAVAVVHHETTTGLLNPVTEVGRLAHARGKLVLVDSVSGLAGDALDLAAADLVVGTGGKCIQAFPGLAFVLVREEAMARLATHPRRSLYLSLPVHHEAQERGTVPFTPAVQLAYALDEALAELLEEGVAARVARYAASASASSASRTGGRSA